MAKTIEIDFWPKQSDVLFELLEGNHSIIGIGGGRGSAKSSCIDRCVINLMAEFPGMLTCVVMRNWDQVLKYHIKVLERDYPWINNLKVTSPASFNIGSSWCDFSYAEDLTDCERRFRSANYDVIAVDQAEQFTQEEIKEIRKACRSKTGKMAKLLLSFNMRGSGIAWLRKWFRDGEGIDPNDVIFFKFDPWDTVAWVLEALKTDAYTVEDYYSWDDDQRKSYAAAKGSYTQQLATDDEVIRQADWEGSWDSFEGSFFSNSFDLETTRIPAVTVELLRKPWSVHWISCDWGKAHWCAVQWHFRVLLSPLEIHKILGWTVDSPLSVVVTYREKYYEGLESSEVANRVITETPEFEQKLIKAFYLGPDAFAERDAINTTAIQIGKALQGNPIRLPGPVRADNDRKGGYSLMSVLLKANKGHGYLKDRNNKPFQVNDVWLISSECPVLLNSIPMLMRNPKDIEDVLKTDKSSAKIEMDSTDAARYGIKSMLRPKKKSPEDVFQEQMSATADDPAKQTMIAFRHMNKTKPPKSRWEQKLEPSWKSNLK